MKPVFKWIYLGVVLGVVGMAYATMPKTWVSGEKVTATDLNANFSHAEQNFRNNGSGHTLITNADIAGGAAISHTKLNTPALVPKGWAYLATACAGASADGTSCTVNLSAGALVSVTTQGTTGLYGGLISPAPANANYGILAQSQTAGVYCTVEGLGTTNTATLQTFTVRCRNDAGGAADAALFLLYFDDV